MSSTLSYTEPWLAVYGGPRVSGDLAEAVSWWMVHGRLDAQPNPIFNIKLISCGTCWAVILVCVDAWMSEGWLRRAPSEVFCRSEALDSVRCELLR